MSRLPEWSAVTKLMLERIGPKALARLEKIIEEGSSKEALTAAKMILDRVAPEPKVDSSARSLQFITPASGTQTAELMERMKRRIEAQPAQIEAPEAEEPDQEDPAEQQ